MKERITTIVRVLKIEFGCVWAIALATAMAYEMEWLPEGVWVGDGRVCYAMQVTGILMAMGFIPFSLRLFRRALVRSLRHCATDDEKLVSYRRWSEVRLALLLVALVFNLCVYYQTLDNTGLLCAGMVLVASLFCVPGRNRLLSELGFDQEENDGEQLRR